MRKLFRSLVHYHFSLSIMAIAAVVFIIGLLTMFAPLITQAVVLLVVGAIWTLITALFRTIQRARLHRDRAAHHDADETP